MTDETGVEASASASEELRPEPLPDGEYAIVEVMGHRTMIGRISEVERFGTKLCAIEPIFAGALLPAVLVGGSSIYQLTSCTAEAALRRAPTRHYQLPSSIVASLPLSALPAPSEPALASRFLDGDDDESEPF